MRTRPLIHASLVALGALAILPGVSSAQDAPAADAPPVPPANPPVEGSVSADMSTPLADAAAPAEEAAEGPSPMPGWIRIDSDGGGLQLWGGGTLPLADGVGLAFDLYALQLGGGNSLGELDVGPAITAGPFTITPMIGLQIDWSLRKAAALVPQLYVVGGPAPIYAELWLQYYMYKAFDYGTSNQLYGRLFVDYKLSDYIAVGPEVDWILDSEADPGLLSLAIGPNVMLSNVGAGGVFIAFIGYETKDTFGEPDEMGVVTSDTANHLTGRLTFVKNF